jgi:diguanylate cyclase (GGDEF)-like protein
MRHETAPARDPGGVEPARLEAACRRAAEAARAADGPKEAVDAALAVLEEELSGPFVTALAVEHGLLWVVGSSGHAMLSDGLDVGEGVVGRALRDGRTQFVPDVSADPDFVAVAKGVVAELATPLRTEEGVVGVLNIETVVPLPSEAEGLLGDLPGVLAPAVASLRGVDTPSLSSLARFFVYISTLRDPRAIADVVVRAVVRILSLDSCQVVLEAEGLQHVNASWQPPNGLRPLGAASVASLRGRLEPTAVLEVLDAAEAGVAAADRPDRSSIVVMPLRAAREDLGLLIGTTREPLAYDAARAEAAALVVAHGAASMDAAITLTRERLTALTDPLTGLLNRRGLEEVLELQLELAQDRRLPLSIAVVDCDDLKDLNDRAGHEFGDAALREIGLVLPAVVGDGARVARLGGDEFAVILSDADADAGEGRADEIRSELADGLTEAGFALHVSVGLATYPYDGAGATQLLRAADQALYEAKATGKNRSVSFRSLVRRSAAGTPLPRGGGAERTGSGVGRKVLAEALEAASAIWDEQTTDGTLERLAKSMTFVLGAVGCAISRVDGDRIVDVYQHSLRTIDLGEEGSYLIDDFPITRDVLTTGMSKAISFLDEDLDRGEAFVLRELRMNCCLLMALRVGDATWGLVEVYDMRMRRFEPDAQAAAEFLVRQAGRRLEALGDAPTRRRRGRLFRVPYGASGESSGST